MPRGRTTRQGSITYRSRFEARVAKTLPAEFQYEATRLTYTTQHTYTPDWVNTATKEIIETKGVMTSQDRSKMLAVKAAHPEWRVTFIFQNPDLTLSKTSTTTYAAWATKHGFLWRRG